MNHFSTIPQALKEIKQGKLLIVIDNPTRENEGDFFIPVQNATYDSILTMIKLGGGLICVAITEQQAKNLELPLMVNLKKNDEKTKVNFTISFSARKGISSGVSVHDRLKTIKTVGNPESSSSDLTRPGHVLGLVARKGGVLRRNGHTEAAVDLARLAGFTSAGVLCEIVGKNGNMAKLPELIKLSKKLAIRIIAIKDLITFIRSNPAK